MPQTDFPGATASEKERDRTTAALKFSGTRPLRRAFGGIREVEAVVGLTGISAYAVKANDGKFCAAVSLAVTGDVARAKDIVVTHAEDVEGFGAGVPSESATASGGQDAAFEGEEAREGEGLPPPPPPLRLMLLDVAGWRAATRGEEVHPASVPRVLHGAGEAGQRRSRCHVRARALGGALRLQEAMNAYGLVA